MVARGGELVLRHKHSVPHSLLNNIERILINLLNDFRILCVVVCHTNVSRGSQQEVIGLRKLTKFAAYKGVF